MSWTPLPDEHHENNVLGEGPWEAEGMTASDKQVDRAVAQAAQRDPFVAQMHAVLRGFQNAGNDPDGYVRELTALARLLQR